MVRQHVDCLLRRVRRLIAAISLSLVAAPAFACLVCLEQPDETLTDRVWSAQAVVLARNSAQSRFAYATMRMLAGASDEPSPLS